jgi:signal transduction histidine kinase/CheY-like chemotaxis protein
MKPRGLSFQAKVLLAVLVVLVPMPVITVWLVNDFIGDQMLDEARQTLASAEDAFLSSLDNRSRNLLSRYEAVANEMRVKMTADVGDPRTTDRLLRDLLNEASEEIEVMLFSNEAEVRLAGRSRGIDLPVGEFEESVADLTRVALAGEAVTGSLALNGKAYNVVAVPVTAQQGPPVGALTIGIRISDATVQQLRPPRTEILLVAQGEAVASTLRNPDRDGELMKLVSRANAAGRNVQIVLDNEHYLALTGKSDASRTREGFGYLLLSSYEMRLHALGTARRMLVAVGAGGVLLGVAAVWFFVRRITQPLRELRDMAEAVGRGDFSRKIARFSNDECGELAEEFNQMTANLQGSRAELEKTVSTLKNTQAQLIQSEKLSAVGQFVAGVAHELNNPLTAVIGFADLLGSSEVDEKNRRHLELIGKSAHRCHKIVHSLLSFARQHAPERKLVGINSVVDDVLEIMAYDLRTSNVTVKREFAEGLPPLMADPHQLQQVFVNILGNARHALEGFRRDGEIVVRTRQSGSQVLVAFQDNGPGIRSDNLSRIFDPFFTTKPVGKGTGLGLSLSYGIIQEHGGKITVCSEPGHGATFVIELPIADSAPAADNRVSGTVIATNVRSGMGAGRSVLVVDDETWILELTQELLRREGFAVETVTGGEKALARIAERKFDVIVCDWKMPGLNGMHVYEQLMTTDRVSAGRMLFMTGDVINEAFQEFLRKNGRPCLSKPFAIDEFRAAVATVGAEKRA